VDKPTVNQQLADSSVLQGISVNRVAKKVRDDVLSLLALAAAEYWNDSELRLWASLSGFDGAKLVMPNGRVAIVKLKIGQQWTSDDLRTYLRALRTAKQNPGKYLSVEAQVAFAFRATGKLTFATTAAGEVQTDAKLFKMIFPALAEQPASLG
jgi:hypothetical protein